MKSKLTEKEKAIVVLLSEGYTSKEIAKKLGNKSTTVDAHKNNLLSRFPVRNTAQLVGYCIRNKLIK